MGVMLERNIGKYAGGESETVGEVNPWTYFCSFSIVLQSTKGKQWQRDFDIDLLAAIGAMPGGSVYVRMYIQQVQHIEKLQHLLVHRTNKNIHRRKQ
jgi:hypothetical protein